VYYCLKVVFLFYFVVPILFFLYRYCRLFDSVLYQPFKHRTQGPQGGGASGASGAGYQSSSSYAGSLGSLGAHTPPPSGPSGGGTGESADPKLIIHLYHMIAAMDGVYEFLSEHHEDWRTGMKTWLLRYVLRLFYCLLGVHVVGHVSGFFLFVARPFCKYIYIIITLFEKTVPGGCLLFC
jgi:hypothetical protein